MAILCVSRLYNTCVESGVLERERVTCDRRVSDPCYVGASAIGPNSRHRHAIRPPSINVDHSRGGRPMLPGPGSPTKSPHLSPTGFSPGWVAPHAALDPPIHWATGRFSDPNHAADFESNAFRKMFWVHSPILLLIVLADVLFDPDNDLAHFFFVGLDVLVIVARVGLHLLSDQGRARRIGIAIWVVFCIFSSFAIAHGFYATPRRACMEAVQPLWMFFLAIMSSTLGLSFWRKSALCVLYLVTWVLPGAIKCQARKTIAMQGVLLLAGSAIAHGVEMHARRRYMRSQRGQA